MKKLFSAVLASLMFLLTAVPAYADAALPRRYSYTYYVASKWIIAIIVAVVIVAAAICAQARTFSLPVTRHASAYPAAIVGPLPARLAIASSESAHSRARFARGSPVTS